MAGWKINLPERTSGSECASSKRGRPRKLFTESSERTKLRSAHSLDSKHTQEELTYAAGVSLSKSGKRDAATILKEATQTTPTRARKIKKIISDPCFKSRSLYPLGYGLSGAERAAYSVQCQLQVHAPTRYTLHAPLHSGRTLRFP